jgi:lysophospholipase
MLKSAPYHADIAGHPDGICHWLLTVDGVRVRVGHWPVANAKGTVLIFPGRTEYVEKHGRTALDFGKRGYACAAIDWRGQGLADRLLENHAVGHVDSFEDYQLDVKAMLDHVKSLGLPEPYHMLGHSMSGCIGLRALYEGLPVKSAVFSAPMWGIKMSAALRPIAWGLSSVSKPLGFSGLLAPGQQAETYVLRATVEDNALTSDASSFDLLQQQLISHPELALGGPSLHWLNESLREMRVTFLGTKETIVDPARVYQRMAQWPRGELVVLENGRHEVLMEIPAIRNRVLDGSVDLFNAQTTEMA